METTLTPNKRVCPRVPVELNVKLRNDSNQECSVLMRDISLSGFGLKVSKGFDLDERTRLRLDFLNNGENAWVSLHVCRYDEQDDGQMRIGATLSCLGVLGRCRLSEYVRERLRQKERRSFFSEGAGFKALG
tara:strand:- start:443 stop:838 length:396 start_codon:yes stop_codon:yes gene_type:complete